MYTKATLSRSSLQIMISYQNIQSLEFLYNLFQDRLGLGIIRKVSKDLENLQNKENDLTFTLFLEMTEI